MQADNRVGTNTVVRNMGRGRGRGMMDRLVREQIGTILGIDPTLVDYTFKFTPAYNETVIVARGREQNCVAIGYLANDKRVPNDYWEQGAKGIFREFSSQDQRDNFIVQIEQSNRMCLVVDCFKNGSCSLEECASQPCDRIAAYQLTNPTHYVESKGCVRPAAVFMPPQHVQDAYNAKTIEFEQLVSACDAILKQFSEWRNKQVYGVITEYVAVDPMTGNTRPAGSGRMQRQSDRHVWGIIGYDAALALLEKKIAEIAYQDATCPFQ
jgi:hypothetical protein